ncbi:RICIN domain-containing protein [Pyxidicoccus sp. 3LFB2]
MKQGLGRFAVLAGMVAGMLVAAPASAQDVLYREVVVALSGNCLDLPGWSGAKYEVLQQYDCNGGTNQQWIFRPVGDGYYNIISVHSGQCVDVPNSATYAINVQQYPCNGQANQQWYYEPTTRELIARHSGMCLTTQGTANKTKVFQGYCSYSPGQQWTLNP